MLVFIKDSQLGILRVGLAGLRVRPRDQDHQFLQLNNI